MAVQSTYAGGYGGYALSTKVLEAVLYMLEVVNGVRCVLRVLGLCSACCILEAGESELRLVDVLE